MRCKFPSIYVLFIILLESITNLFRIILFEPQFEYALVLWKAAAFVRMKKWTLPVYETS